MPYYETKKVAHAESQNYDAMHVNAGGFRTLVFKNRGALLVPVALVLLIFGRPSTASAIIGVAIAAL